MKATQIEKLRQIVNDAPVDDWTHYALNNANHALNYLKNIDQTWFYYETGCPEITCCKEWHCDFEIDCFNEILSRKQIETIIAQYDEIERLKNRVQLLEQSIMSNCYDDPSTSGKRLMALVLPPKED